MIIKTILRSEFDRLLPHDPALENWMVEQVEWFSNSSGNMLGTIAKGLASWNYIILERDKLGDLYVHKVMNNFFSLDTARVDLLLWMSGSEKIARIDLLLSMTEIEKSRCTNQSGLPIPLTSPALLAVVDRARKTPDIKPAV